MNSLLNRNSATRFAAGVLLVFGCISFEPAFAVEVSTTQTEPSGKPDQKPDQKPSQKPDKKPDQKPSQKPDKKPSGKPYQDKPSH